MMKKEKGRLVSISDTLLMERVTAQSVFRKRDVFVYLDRMEMKERHVYYLIDGKRSLEDIAQLLHLDREATARYTAYLLQLHCCIERVPTGQRERNEDA